MQRLDRAQIVRFLHAVDAALDNEMKIIVIGGMAAIVKYDAAVKTADMDVLAVVSGSGDDFARAARVASAATGLSFLIDPASIADLPWNYTDRLKPIRLRLRKLAIVVPDKYDLVLSKMLRGDEHDYQAIVSIHEKHRLSEKILVARYEAEMDHVMGDRRNVAADMIRLLRRLYGDARAEVYRKRWLDH